MIFLFLYCLVSCGLGTYIMYDKAGVSGLTFAMILNVLVLGSAYILYRDVTKKYGKDYWW